MDLTINKKRATILLAVGALSVVGTFVGGAALMWVVGTLGISTAAATQIVSAIAAGGWALRAVIIIFGAGIIGAIAATVIAIISSSGRNIAIA
ncbi:hypothetical protein [Glycomyces salinus]|uniref:hypothetical protein n=1 Tax=Glycomyces salinus TaxID=980294 RepID=UPI0018EDD407|nr:hypothetical protein [Glycomyces salinus]